MSRRRPVVTAPDSTIFQCQCETCGFLVTATTIPSMAASVTAHQRAVNHPVVAEGSPAAARSEDTPQRS